MGTQYVQQVFAGTYVKRSPDWQDGYFHDTLSPDGSVLYVRILREQVVLIKRGAVISNIM
jgi:hypothetical protein